jgi:hypothetical protein
MAVPTDDQLGPLARLVGTWEGEGGVDVAYMHALSTIGDTPFRERMTFSPFGPVDNGNQCLFGLDYRTAAWRTERDEPDPFHTEVGYWLWDAATSEVMRCFMVPRGSTILAGGPATQDATSFTMKATVGDEVYGVLSNPYLAANAQTTAYEVTITFNDDGSFTYESTTTIDHARCDDPLLHTDRNTLDRVD